MFEDNYRNLMNLAEELLHKERTPEEALQVLVLAGILDENDNYTEPYKILEQHTASK